MFINFTDENLTMSKELKDVVNDTAVVGCELHVKCHGTQPAGRQSVLTLVKIMVKKLSMQFYPSR